MNHPNRGRALRAPLSLALLCAFGGAVATETPTVVVGASRFVANPLDQAIAVQIIDAETIRASAADTLAEVLQRIGGVHLRGSMTGLPDAPLDLRGMGISGDQNTLVLIDGQRLSENELIAARLSTIPLDAIDRIEILRGAGAVVYGGGATSGTINIVTRGAAAVPQANLRLAVGSNDLRELALRADTPLAIGGLTLNLQRRSSDNYREHNASTQTSADAQWRWRSAASALSLSLAGDDQEVDLPGARTAAQLKSDRRGSDTLKDRFEARERRASLRAEHALGAVTLAFDLTRREKRSDFHNEVAAWAYVSDQAVAVDASSLSPRLQWRGEFAGLRHLASLGADWSSWDYRNDSRSSFGDRDERGEQSQRAIYLRDEIAWGAATRFTFGARRERVRVDQLERLAPLPEQVRRDTVGATEFAVQQRLSAATTLYLRGGRSFRVANIDENRCWFPPCAPLLAPQRSTDREFGVNWRANGTALRASLFQNDLRDELHYNALAFSNMNLQPTRRRGLELDGRWQLGAFDLGARYALTQARFRQGEYGGVDIAGNEVPMVPKRRAGASLGWQVEAATRLNLLVDHVGRQRYDNDQANRFRQMPAYTTAALKLTHQRGAWRLFAGVDNLFDKDFYSYAIVNGAGTSFNAYPEVGRIFNAGAEYQFK